MEIDEIKAIVELMAKHNLSEFKVEADNMHLCLKRDFPAPVQHVAMPAYPPSMMNPHPVPTQSLPASDAPKADKPEALVENQITIDSPIVGTFYRAPSPEAEPFVKIGDKVDAETVVCVIEAMKVLNEIKAEKAGVIKEILVENAQTVEYGCPLFVLE